MYSELLDVEVFPEDTKGSKRLDGNTRRLTICTIQNVNDPSEIYEGDAICCPTDVFVKEKGREIAMKNALVSAPREISGNLINQWLHRSNTKIGF
jgi:hypothetical protein